MLVSALLKLLNLVGLEAQAKRSRFTRDEKAGEKACLANEDMLKLLLNTAEPLREYRALEERGSREVDFSGLLLLSVYYWAPEEWCAFELPEMPANSASSQVGSGPKESESPGVGTWESDAPWGDSVHS